MMFFTCLSVTMLRLILEKKKIKLLYLLPVVLLPPAEKHQVRNDQSEPGGALIGCLFTKMYPTMNAKAS